MTDQSDITYDKTVAEVAVDLHLNEETLREAFSVWLHGRGCVHPSLPPEYNHACYAVYRLVKCKSAFRMTSKSRSRWRERAMELGSPGHLATRPDPLVKAVGASRDDMPPSAEWIDGYAKGRADERAALDQEQRDV